MNKKTIITILLALVSMAGQARKTVVVWEETSMVFTTYRYFQIKKVELSKQQTKLFCTYFGRREVQDFQGLLLAIRRKEISRC